MGLREETARSLRAEVLALLDTLGVDGADTDPLIPYLLGSVCERVCNGINRPEIPDGLRHVAAGEYLAFCKNAGRLDMDGLDLDAAVKQLTEGDTSTTYAVGEGSLTPEQRLEALIGRLCRDRTAEFLRYRKFVW